MAHIFTNTGLSAMLGVFPRTASAQPTAYWMGFFGSQTSGTVPSRTAFYDAAPGGFSVSVGLPSISMAANAWLAGQTSGAGAAVTAAQQVVTATAGGSANGYFIANRPTAGAGSIVFSFANFDDLTTIPYNSGDIVRVTPTFGFHVSAGA